MRESTRRKLISLFFCFLACLLWGLETFFVNLRAYLDNLNGTDQNQPLAISFALIAIGEALSAIIFLIVWPQRPFMWMHTKQACWSFVTGVFYAVGLIFYILAANAGMPASIVAPVSSLDITVPPLFHMIIKRQCVSWRMILGYMCALISITLYSGTLSGGENERSQRITGGEWICCILIIISWGFGLLAQDVAGRDLLFRQFPQSQIWLSIGFFIACLIATLCVSPGILGERSSWIPLTVDQGLMVLSSFLDGAGTGFFTLCVSFADDLNLVVGFSSLYTTIPTVLGLVFLHEPATWNVLLGLFFVCCGVLILSQEAVNEDVTPIRASVTPMRASSPTHRERDHSRTANSGAVSGESNDLNENFENEKKIPLLSLH